MSKCEHLKAISIVWLYIIGVETPEQDLKIGSDFQQHLRKKGRDANARYLTNGPTSVSVTLGLLQRSSNGVFILPSLYRRSSQQRLQVFPPPPKTSRLTFSTSTEHLFGSSFLSAVRANACWYGDRYNTEYRRGEMEWTVDR